MQTQLGLGGLTPVPRGRRFEYMLRFTLDTHFRFHILLKAS